MELIPLVVAKVVNVGEDVVMAKLVADEDEAGVVGGTSSQTSLTSITALISPMHTILTPSIGISRQWKIRMCGRTNAHLINKEVTQ